MNTTYISTLFNLRPTTGCLFIPEHKPVVSCCNNRVFVENVVDDQARYQSLVDEIGEINHKINENTRKAMKIVGVIKKKQRQNDIRCLLVNPETLTTEGFRKPGNPLGPLGDPIDVATFQADDKLDYATYMAAVEKAYAEFQSKKSITDKEIVDLQEKLNDILSQNTVLKDQEDGVFREIASSFGNEALNVIRASKDVGVDRSFLEYLQKANDDHEAKLNTPESEFFDLFDKQEKDFGPTSGGRKSSGAEEDEYDEDYVDEDGYDSWEGEEPTVTIDEYGNPIEQSLAVQVVTDPVEEAIAGNGVSGRWSKRQKYNGYGQTRDANRWETPVEKDIRAIAQDELDSLPAPIKTGVDDNAIAETTYDIDAMLYGNDNGSMGSLAHTTRADLLRNTSRYKYYKTASELDEASAAKTEKLGRFLAKTDKNHKQLEEKMRLCREEANELNYAAKDVDPVGFLRKYGQFIKKYPKNRGTAITDLINRYIRENSQTLGANLESIGADNLAILDNYLRGQGLSLAECLENDGVVDTGLVDPVGEFEAFDSLRENYSPEELEDYYKNDDGPLKRAIKKLIRGKW